MLPERLDVPADVLSSLFRVERRWVGAPVPASPSSSVMSAHRRLLLCIIVSPAIFRDRVLVVCVCVCVCVYVFADGAQAAWWVSAGFVCIRCEQKACCDMQSCCKPELHGERFWAFTTGVRHRARFCSLTHQVFFRPLGPRQLLAGDLGSYILELIFLLRCCRSCGIVEAPCTGSAGCLGFVLGRLLLLLGFA